MGFSLQREDSRKRIGSKWKKAGNKEKWEQGGRWEHHAASLTILWGLTFIKYTLPRASARCRCSQRPSRDGGGSRDHHPEKWVATLCLKTDLHCSSQHSGLPKPPSFVNALQRLPPAAPWNPSSLEAHRRFTWSATDPPIPPQPGLLPLPLRMSKASCTLCSLTCLENCRSFLTLKTHPLQSGGPRPSPSVFLISFISLPLSPRRASVAFLLLVPSYATPWGQGLLSEFISESLVPATVPRSWCVQ